MEGPDRLSMGGPEGGEVVPALQDLRGFGHRGRVQRPSHPERRALAERAARPVPDGVPVRSVPGRPAGLPPGLHAPQRAQADVRRQERIEGLGQPPVGDVRHGEGDDLTRGVDTGIRAAGGGDPDPAIAGDRRQRRFEHSLDRPAPWLELEAGEVRAVVFDPCSEPHEAALSGGHGRARARRARSGRSGRRHRRAAPRARGACSRRCDRRTGGRSR